MRNGKQFREALKVVYNMEFDEFQKVFGWTGEYALEKYKLMQKSLIHFIGQLDDNNMDHFFRHLMMSIELNSVNLIKDLAHPGDPGSHTPT